MAVTSGIDCTVTVDEGKLDGTAKCLVPLKAIKVDNDDTKTEHFQQWTTNKKSESEKCTFDLDVPGVKLPSALAEKKPVSFTAAYFTPKRFMATFGDYLLGYGNSDCTFSQGE